jgi:ankyrin repeat protein
MSRVMRMVEAADEGVLLWRAVARDDVAYVRSQLDAGLDPNDCGTNGISLLEKAVTASSAGVCQLLLRVGAIVDFIGAGMLSPALHEAAQRANVEICQLLLDAGADPNSAGKRRLTPLLHVVSNGSRYRGWVECAELLLSRGANPNVTAGGANETVLHIVVDASARIEANRIEEPGDAAWGSASIVVRMLLEHGADPDFLPVGATSDYLTPFQSAVKAGFTVDVAAFMKGRAVDFAQRTVGGKTLRQLASRHPEVSQLIRSHSVAQQINSAVGAESPKDLEGQPVRRHNSLLAL